MIVRVSLNVVKRIFLQNKQANPYRSDQHSFFVLSGKREASRCLLRAAVVPVGPNLRVT